MIALNTHRSWQGFRYGHAKKLKPFRAKRFPSNNIYKRKRGKIIKLNRWKCFTLLSGLRTSEKAEQSHFLDPNIVTLYYRTSLFRWKPSKKTYKKSIKNYSYHWIKTKYFSVWKSIEGRWNNFTNGSFLFSCLLGLVNRKKIYAEDHELSYLQVFSIEAFSNWIRLSERDRLGSLHYLTFEFISNVIFRVYI